MKNVHISPCRVIDVPSFLSHYSHATKVNVDELWVTYYFHFSDINIPDSDTTFVALGRD